MKTINDIFETIIMFLEIPIELEFPHNYKFQKIIEILVHNLFKRIISLAGYTIVILYVFIYIYPITLIFIIIFSPILLFSGCKVILNVAGIIYCFKELLLMRKQGWYEHRPRRGNCKKIIIDRNVTAADIFPDIEESRIEIFKKVGNYSVWRLIDKKN